MSQLRSAFLKWIGGHAVTIAASCCVAFAQDGPPPVALPPLGHPSIILTTIVVPKSVLTRMLEDAVPLEQRGTQADPVGMPVIDDALDWHLQRGDLGVALDNSEVRVSAAIGGSATLHGIVQLIRGDVGRFLRHLNPTRFPFSVSLNLRASVAAAAHPQLLPSWRLQPNFSASVAVQEARVPIRHVGDISVRGKVQDAVDGEVEKLRARLEAKMRDDRRIEDAARKAWTQMCKAHRIDIRKDDGPALFLRVTPVLARATQPQIDRDAVTIQVGIEANTEVGEEGAPPECPFPPALQLLPIEEPRFDIAMPAEISFETLTKAAQAALPATIDRPDMGIAATIRAVRIAAQDQTRLQVQLEGTFVETRFSGAGVTGTILVTGRPVLDAALQQLKFANVTLDVRSKDFFGTAGLLAKGAAPFVERWVENNLVIDISKEAGKLRERAGEAAKKLGSSNEQIEVRASFDPPRLAGIEFDSTRLRLVGEAHGRVEVRPR